MGRPAHPGSWSDQPRLSGQEGPELLATGVPWTDGIKLQTQRGATQRGTAADRGQSCWNLGLWDSHRTWATRHKPVAFQGQRGMWIPGLGRLQTVPVQSHHQTSWQWGAGTAIPQAPCVGSGTAGRRAERGHFLHAKPVRLIPKDPRAPQDTCSRPPAAAVRGSGRCLHNRGLLRRAPPGGPSRPMAGTSEWAPRCGPSQGLWLPCSRKQPPPQPASCPGRSAARLGWVVRQAATNVTTAQQLISGFHGSATSPRGAGRPLCQTCGTKRQIRPDRTGPCLPRGPSPGTATEGFPKERSIGLRSRGTSGQTKGPTGSEEVRSGSRPLGCTGRVTEPPKLLA